MNSEEKRLLDDEEISAVAGGAKSDTVEMSGTVIEHLPNDLYMVKLENGDTIKACRSGKLRMNFITLIVGDSVTVEVVPEGNITGRIIYRAKRL